VRTASRISIGIVLTKSQVTKLRNILGKILGTFENVGPDDLKRCFIGRR